MSTINLSYRLPANQKPNNKNYTRARARNHTYSQTRAHKHIHAHAHIMNEIKDMWHKCDVTIVHAVLSVVGNHAQNISEIVKVEKKIVKINHIFQTITEAS